MSRLGKVKRDLVGKRFGKLVVQDEYKRVYVTGGTRIHWLCRCDCGNEMFVDRESLLHSKRLWCPKCRPPGIRNERLYHVYYGIKQRCYNPKTKKYYLYGGKGVKICDEWINNYDAFKKWSIENGYVPDSGLTIDRIDSSGDYSPDNCQWITRSQNSAKANMGIQKSKTKLEDVWAISPDGNKIHIDNIHKFCRETSLNVSSVSAALHGRLDPIYHGWRLHSNKSRY